MIFEQHGIADLLRYRHRRMQFCIVQWHANLGLVEQGSRAALRLVTDLDDVQHGPEAVAQVCDPWAEDLARLLPELEGVSPATPASDDPQISRVSYTGKHRIPILYEREAIAAAPAPASLPS